MRFVVSRFNLILYFSLSLIWHHSAIQAACNITPVLQGQYLMDNPGNMLARPDGKMLFVIDDLAGNINIIDTQEKAIVNAIPIGDAPTALAYDGSRQRLYVSDYFTGTVYIVDVSGDDPQAFKLLKEQKVSEAALGALVYDPATDRVFVSTFKPQDPDTILVLDAENLATASDDLGGDQFSEGISDMLVHNGKLYISFEESNRVGIYDITKTTPELIDTIAVTGTQPTDLSVSSDENLLYVANTGSNTLTRIDLLDNTLFDSVQDMNALSAPRGLAYFDQYVWVANQSGSNLAQYDIHVKGMLPNACYGLSGQRPKHLLAVPQMKQLYVAHSNGVDVVIAQGMDVVCNGCTKNGQVLQAASGARFELNIEGGMGDFNISLSSGGTAARMNDRSWQITAPQPEGNHSLVIYDGDNNNRFLAFTLKVGEGSGSGSSNGDASGNATSLNFIGTDHYKVGDFVRIQLHEAFEASRFETVDLWVAVQIPPQFGGNFFFRKPSRLGLADFAPAASEPFRASLRSSDTDVLHNILEMELPPGMGGAYTFFALYVEEGKNPLLDDLINIQKSDLVMQQIILDNE